MMKYFETIVFGGNNWEIRTIAEGTGNVLLDITNTSEIHVPVLYSKTNIFREIKF